MFKLKLCAAALSLAMTLPLILTGCDQAGGPTAPDDSTQTAPPSAAVTEAVTEALPANLKSKTSCYFSYHDGAEGRGAMQVTTGALSCRFSATATFDELDVSCPSYSDDEGDITFYLYRWMGSYAASAANDPIAKETYEDFPDNATLEFEFPEQEPGEYILTLSDGTGGVGVWAFTESASGTYLYVDNYETPGVFTMDIHYTYTPTTRFAQCKSVVDYSVIVTTPPEHVPGPDDPIVVLDAMPDTWAATDALGRTLPTNAETGDARQGKYVGLFFWTWHSGQNHNRAINVTELQKAHPEIFDDYNHPLWEEFRTGAYHWNEPIYGFYNGVDPWVYRRQAELLATSGVDVVIFDNTNGTYTWREGYLMLCKVFSEARAQGVNTPKISFLLPFNDGPDTVAQLRDLYLTIFRDGLYQDLWFYWDGKPLLMSNYRALDRNDPIESEIRNFFTFRPGEPTYNSKREMKNGKWTWLSVYPQAVTYRDDGTPEQMTVGVAQNWSAEIGLTAMNGENIFGRTHTSQGEDTREDAKLWGANFTEQFEYALDVDPDFIFITGWNEWVAGRNAEWQSVKNAFPDEFNDTYSRDIEPSKGDLADNYYYQMVSFIRRYKGTRAVPEASAQKTVDIAKDASQWDDVSPRYLAYAGNTFDRDCPGYGDLHYTDTTGRNDLTEAKLARDSENFYFMVRCAEDITPYEADTGWMRLYLDCGEIGAAQWNTFDYIVEPRGDGKADVLVYAGDGMDWLWNKVGEASYTVSGNTLQLSLGRALIGMTDTSSLYFKWSDNTCITGDIMDFYIHGDAAPLGRFKYSYQAGN
ncbi:MAG: hypothetical protein MJ175_04920 [Clostridia bacterium]|nr:hypothetical protein [Clostridia bacterium]